MNIYFLMGGGLSDFQKWYPASIVVKEKKTLIESVRQKTAKRNIYYACLCHDIKFACVSKDFGITACLYKMTQPLSPRLLECLLT